METGQLNRYSKLKLSSDFVLKNRVVVPPMASQTAAPDGFVTPTTLNHYARLAEARAGLLIVEYTFVHRSGRSEEFQLGISSDAHIPGLTRIASMIKLSGKVAGIQFSHGGGKSNTQLTGGNFMGPSAIPVPVKGESLEIPREMSLEEVAQWRDWFVTAADRAVRAGFDLVELHSAHGYGLNQWLSPITNQRTDFCGRNLEGRARLLLEIVERIRKNHPRLLLSVRLPGQDFQEEGLQLADTIAVAKMLEQRGVNIIHVSSGIGGWRRPSDRSGEGYLVAEASAIQTHVAIPVIGVGGIESGDYIDQGLSAGRFSLAAVGRAILKAPKAWSEIHLATTC